MLYLVVATLFSAGFGLIVRWAQRRNDNLWAVGALNYVTAFFFHSFRAGIGGSVAPSRPTAVIGVLGGIAYVSAFFLYFAFMARRGVSIATAVIRLGVVLPIMVSVVFWGERLEATQSAGVFLALAALPLLTVPHGHAESLQRSGLWLRAAEGIQLAFLALANGLCMLAVRGFEQSGVRGEASLFLAFLFGTAALVGVAVWSGHRQGTSRRDLLPGIALGLCNALANLALVAALERLPGVLVFPFYSAAGLALTVLFARLFWQEQMRRLELAGMGVALAAVVFVNLHM